MFVCSVTFHKSSIHLASVPVDHILWRKLMWAAPLTLHDRFSGQDEVCTASLECFHCCTAWLGDWEGGQGGGGGQRKQLAVQGELWLRLMPGVLCPCFREMAKQHKRLEPCPKRSTHWRSVHTLAYLSTVTLLSFHSSLLPHCRQWSEGQVLWWWVGGGGEGSVGSAGQTAGRAGWVRSRGGCSQCAGWGCRHPHWHPSASFQGCCHPHCHPSASFQGCCHPHWHPSASFQGCRHPHWHPSASFQGCRHPHWHPSASFQGCCHPHWHPSASFQGCCHPH